MSTVIATIHLLLYYDHKINPMIVITMVYFNIFEFGDFN